MQIDPGFHNVCTTAAIVSSEFTSIYGATDKVENGKDLDGFFPILSEKDIQFISCTSFNRR